MTYQRAKRTAILLWSSVYLVVDAGPLWEVVLYGPGGPSKYFDKRSGRVLT